MTTFGDRLRDLRERKQLSQNELSKVFGLTASTISQYEANKRKPDSEILKGIAEYFGVSIDYLLSVNQSEQPNTTSSSLHTNNDAVWYNIDVVPMQHKMRRDIYVFN
jgi:transcriptional regulator with XRE-family HTH domain